MSKEETQYATKTLIIPSIPKQEDFAYMTRLHYLDLSHNQALIIPEEFFQPSLCKLKVLLLGGNLFASIPPTISLLTDLRVLSLME